MASSYETQIKANELRKKGDINAALPLYNEAWEASKDKFAAAGLVFCYRKLKQFDKAIPIAEEAFKIFPDFDWCRNEYIWSLIQGKLYSSDENILLHEVIAIANKIMEVNPDEIALKITIFKVLKIAKKTGDWNTLNEWIVKIQPDILNGYTDESTGWTDKELWYYYRVNGLIFTSQEKEAIKIIDEKRNEFYKQKKFFDRLKAKAFINTGELEKAEAIYKNLNSYKKEWWLLHEQGKLLVTLNKEPEALPILLAAADAPPMKVEMKVSLFYDIGNLYLKLNQAEHALVHLELTRAIREEKGWATNELEEKLKSLRKADYKRENVRELLNKCRIIWRGNTSDTQVEKNDLQTKNLRGEIIKLSSDKPFCFIKTKDNQSFFCSTGDLPKNISEKQLVQFDLKPSFDKKKQQNSYRACNVKIV